MQSPFRYHSDVIRHFRKNTALWNFFAAESAKQEDFKTFKTELLKNTYRLEPTAEPSVYDAVEKARLILDITHAITVYQLMESTDLNAMVYVLPSEAHIVLSGSILKLLDEHELLAVIAHELGHIKLLSEANGDMMTAHRLLNAVASHTGTSQELLETDRIFDLYTELYCDQMALKVLNDPLPVVSSLVKVNTGLEKVSGESYIRQSVEIFGSGNIKSERVSHPENFIRAYAIHLAHTNASTFETAITPIIEGSVKLQALDIFTREKLEQYSRAIITAIIGQSALQTEVVVNLAKQYFPDIKATSVVPEVDEHLAKMLDEGSKEYIACLMLDFILADSSAEQDMFSHIYELATRLHLADTLKTIMRRELKLTEKKFNERYKKTLSKNA